MEINVKPPGWEKFKWEDVEFKVKVLSFGERLGLVGKPFRDCFAEYVKEIKNLKVGDVEIKEGKDLMDGSVGGGSEKLEEFFNYTLDRFSDMNALTVGETKNSETPPEE